MDLKEVYNKDGDILYGGDFVNEYGNHILTIADTPKGDFFRSEAMFKDTSMEQIIERFLEIFPKPLREETTERLKKLRNETATTF